jgi:hypothetical protein
MNKLIQITIVLLLACTLAKATNTPSSCTANITANDINVKQNDLIDITVRSYNVPSILINYDVALYADDVLIETATNVACYGSSGEYGFFEYTFEDVQVTKLGMTRYTAKIYKKFLIIFIVEVFTSNYVDVAGRTTTLSEDQLDQNNIEYTLYNILTVNGPALRTGDPAPTGTIYCHTIIRDTSPLDIRDTDTGGLALFSDRVYTGTCDIGQVLPGQVVQTNVTYNGDANYPPSKYTLDFVGTEAFARAGSAPLAAGEPAPAPLAVGAPPPKKKKKVATRNNEYLV